MAPCSSSACSACSLRFMPAVPALLMNNLCNSDIQALVALGAVRGVV